VAHPRDEDDLEAVLDWALQAGAAVIPFGGDTSVVGGVEPVVPEHFAGVVTIDMQALDRVLEVDRAAPGCSRPSAAGRHRWGWREAFLRARYLRDTFVAMEVLSETLETSITWDRFDRLPRRGARAGGRGGARRVRPGLDHLSLHAADAIIGDGGTITHHHAVGRDHRGAERLAVGLGRLTEVRRSDGRA